MKKTLFLLIVLATFIRVDAQSKKFPVDENNQVKYEEVVLCNLNKTVLYSNAQKWIAKSFGDYKSVIQFEDAVNGKLIFKAKSKVPYTVPLGKGDISVGNSETINYTFTIECKDNKYRYTVDDITIDTECTMSFLGEVTSDVVRGNDANYRLKMYLEDEKLLPSLIHTKDSLESINTVSLKRKELKAHNTNLETVNSRIKGIKSPDRKDFYISEVETMENLITSLKTSMCKSDDF
ncbi:MAG: DUF4468 domain-containing protein [Paludibacter sp.]|nr:DUF4468 domain-containing protein [Paludibacter sp.]